MEIGDRVLFRGQVLRDVPQDGDTPLHLAAVNDDSGVTRSLVEAGEDANAKNKEGGCVAGWAILGQHTVFLFG